MPCCDECTSTNHSKCTGIKSLTSVVEKTQVEKSKESIEKDINSILHFLDGMTKNKISIKKDISDMICLMDGRIIAVELNAEVNITTSQGILQKQLPISGEAYSVTQINHNTIAITLGRKYNDSIQVKSDSYLENIVYCNDIVIYSDIDGNAVYCVDGSGKQIWRYKQDLEGPRGLCTDSYGNIIVADCDSDRIIVISKDGQDSKVLIGKENGLKNPMCIFYKHTESSGLICNELGTYLAKFNLSSG
ncbi:uncharacterized protein [Mytilus edulis]|uniref:uncharacterized protein n=1 Tax=Mytilus edulis TaxID=6550 RepID=UPI0039EFC4E6